ncbi:hypothetical protein IscW_ISCW012497, partial [Ixodes scapularis]
RGEKRPGGRFQRSSSWASHHREHCGQPRQLSRLHGLPEQFTELGRSSHRHGLHHRGG